MAACFLETTGLSPGYFQRKKIHVMTENKIQYYEESQNRADHKFRAGMCAGRDSAVWRQHPHVGRVHGVVAQSLYCCQQCIAHSCSVIHPRHNICNNLAVSDQAYTSPLALKKRYSYFLMFIISVLRYVSPPD